MLPVSTAPEARRRTHAGPEDAGAEAAHDETAQALLTAWPPLDKAQARPQARPAPPRAADREQPPVFPWLPAQCAPVAWKACARGQSTAAEQALLLA